MGWAGCCSRHTNKVALWSETSKESVTSRLKRKEHCRWKEQQTGRPLGKES